jgi:two-component system alkaline phosphatase synthesis response regulator PhoP
MVGCPRPRGGRAKDRIEEAETVSTPLVLIVEDESDIAALIEYHLTREEYRTRVVTSGRAAVDLAMKLSPDLILLDIMLPDLDGLEVCRKLKDDPASRGIPILIVSACGEESDVVKGLDLGADDYMVKPFSPRILIARARALLRRRKPKTSGRLVLADNRLIIDNDRHTVHADGQLADVTPTQYRLLHYLASRPGFVRTRQQIVGATHGEGTILSNRAVDVHMAGLRQRLGPLGCLVQTVRGVGYRFVDDDESIEDLASSPVERGGSA